MDSEEIMDALDADGSADVDLSSGKFQHEDIKQEDFDGGGEDFTE